MPSTNQANIVRIFIGCDPRETVAYHVLSHSSRWYKSVTIERQQTLMEWQPVLKRVRDKLQSGDIS
ncbi:MAG: hypothetical protein KGI29_03155 [Pseudomonadota bacterium]|nr:hypothetical protein [Pseudomonadota bacterium]MDE3037456.1 hypothetical protein [Pseudomonadota bacterium]